LVVVIPDLPRVIAEVLVVPILTVPLVAPAPALIETLPPVVVPVPVSLPAERVRFPPEALLVELAAGIIDKPLPPVRVVISGLRPPARAS
jgi:hypothetical protein